MTIFLYVGPEFIYSPLFVGPLALTLAGGGLLFAFLPRRPASNARQPRSRATKAFRILLGVVLIVAGTATFCLGLWLWAFDGYQEDAGTGTADTAVWGLLTFSLGITVIASGVGIIRRVRRPSEAAPPTP